MAVESTDPDAVLETRRLLHGALPEAFVAEGEGAGEAVADFSLLDVNSTSATYDQGVSPRDYLQQVSAWYFGHAT